LAVSSGVRSGDRNWVPHRQNVLIQLILDPSRRPVGRLCGCPRRSVVWLREHRDGQDTVLHEICAKGGTISFAFGRKGFR